jgi:predicted histone-like DNA-binding protein
MIRLKIIQRPNPLDATADRKYYVSSQTEGDITLEEMSELISEKCTLTETDVLAAITALMREMTLNLMTGKIVRFGSFGSFKLSLNSSGVATETEATRLQVKGARVRFRPGKRIEDSLRNLKDTLTTKE